MSGEARQGWFNHNYEDIKSSYDVRLSVEQMKEIIYNIDNGKDMPQVQGEVL